ncbi:MAG TPA: hypothetical protein VGM32_21385, partial [Rhodopila sp.]
PGRGFLHKSLKGSPRDFRKIVFLISIAYRNPSGDFSGEIPSSEQRYAADKWISCRLLPLGRHVGRA